MKVIVSIIFHHKSVSVKEDLATATLWYVSGPPPLSSKLTKNSESKLKQANDSQNLKPKCPITIETQPESYISIFAVAITSKKERMALSLSCHTAKATNSSSPADNSKAIQLCTQLTNQRLGDHKSLITLPQSCSKCMKKCKTHA